MLPPPPGCDEPKKPGLDRVKRSKRPTACNAKFKKVRGHPCLFHGIQLSWGMRMSDNRQRSTTNSFIIATLTHESLLQD